MRARSTPLGHRVAALLLALFALGSLTLLAWPAGAATELLYVPQTGHYVKGVFRDFWDKSGGLPNFGYPITEEYIDPASGRVFQYFERARFERAGIDSTNVELANLGLVALGGRTFPRQQPIQNTAQRRYFPETGQIVQYGFKTVWETRGEQAIFGLPLSSEIEEKVGNTTRTVQYFEKARFEYWPELPDGQRVVLSALGRQYAPLALTAPAPPPGSTATPTAAPATSTPTAAPTTATPTPAPAPAGAKGNLTPAVGLVGQTFTFSGSGFRSKENVSFWLTAPGGAVYAFDAPIESDKNGAIGPFSFVIEEGDPLGTWAFTAQGVKSERNVVAYFVVLQTPTGALPRPTPQPSIPPNVNASVTPEDGPTGTLFFFDARGFRAGEDVKLAVIGSDGRQIEFPNLIKADANGGIGYARPYYLSQPGDSLGLYSFVALGTGSGATATAYFVLTP